MSLENNSRPRDAERKTRVHLSLYDRGKFLLFFAAVFFVLVWSDMAGDENLGFNQAVIDSSYQRWWIFPLIAIETLRQTHFLISELAANYHGFWQKYFSFVDRLIHKLSDWTRFRLSRVIKWIVVIALLSVVLGAIYDETPVRALFYAPQALWSALPIIGQLMFAVVFVIIQFVAIFWFLSRGGIDTYFPDDIKTRFTDVWGQDHVLARIRENLVFTDSTGVGTEGASTTFLAFGASSLTAAFASLAGFVGSATTAFLSAAAAPFGNST